MKTVDEMFEPIVQRLGFKDENEYFRLTKRAKKKSGYRNWTRHNGTKAGLKKLLKRQPIK